mmetsp:Transcript_23568/g.49080  ORF Transcript_23568/g.49080 Transcript_23568/m.49080 type:complete len:363 (+) Transcript_23568:225-1313(+)
MVNANPQSSGAAQPLSIQQDANNQLSSSVVPTIPSSHSIQIAVREPDTFLGIPLQNPKKAKLVKIVIWLAMLGVVLESVQFAITLNSGNKTQNTMSSVMNFMIALTIPYCGYKGAKEDDGTMLCWFCGCNFADACYTFLVLIWLHNHINQIGDICDSCAEQENIDYNDSTTDPDVYRRAETCLFEESRNRNLDPHYCTDKNFETLYSLKAKLEAIEIPLAFANLLMFYYGNELYRSYEKVEVDLGQPVLPSVRQPNVLEAQTTVAAPAASLGPPPSGYTQLQPGQPPKPSDTPMATYAQLPFAGEATVAATVDSTLNNPADHITSYTTFATAATLPQEPIFSPPYSQQTASTTTTNTNGRRT